MPPPKRKTTGRVTPKGTKPGDLPRAASTPTSPGSAAGSHGTAGVSASSRYTPPTARAMEESPRWVPVLMIVLLALGGLTILLRYIVWPDTNLPVLFGLAFLLGGLWTATKWR